MKVNITALAPKSDQLNADDLITGPRTVRIRDFKEGPADQPWHIYFDNDNGRPWKPNVSMRRVIVSIWGDEIDKWIGLRLTLHNDESVTFGKDRTGGIRISHMEGLSETRIVMLTTTRGRRKPYPVQPLTVEKQASKAEKVKARLFEIAQGDEKSVADVWGQVPDDVKTELGAEFYDQLVAIETAAQEHRKNDPTAAVDSLNAALSGD